MDSTVAEQSKTEAQERLLILRQLLKDKVAGTQEEICSALRAKSFDITQSTVSRDLRRIGAVKTINASGDFIYRLPEDHRVFTPISGSLSELVTDIQSNEVMIVVHTKPGSASLLATHIDNAKKSLGILGTLAGDDAIFIIPASIKKISTVIKKTQELLDPET